MLFVMWYGASSQNNAAVYLLFFAFASVFLISIPHTLLNVGDLTRKRNRPSSHSQAMKFRSQSKLLMSRGSLATESVSLRQAPVVTTNASMKSLPAKLRA